MKILSLECSAVCASAAVSEDGVLLSECFSGVKLTHSQTLLPMAENALKTAQIALSEIDGFAIAAGPGSFTGLRIGISALKGMAWAGDRSCAAVSTLYAMAHGVISFEGVIVCCMDARCNQVYNALFKSDGGKLTRLCDDRAIIADELAAELAEMHGEQFIFTGDGAKIGYDACNCENKILAPFNLRQQRASGVAAAALEIFEKGETVKSAELMPIYLRLPQAERELKGMIK